MWNRFSFSFFYYYYHWAWKTWGNTELWSSVEGSGSVMETHWSLFLCVCLCVCKGVIDTLACASLSVCLSVQYLWLLCPSLFDWEGVGGVAPLGGPSVSLIDDPLSLILKHAFFVSKKSKIQQDYRFIVVVLWPFFFFFSFLIFGIYPLYLSKTKTTGLLRFEFWNLIPSINRNSFLVGLRTSTLFIFLFVLMKAECNNAGLNSHRRSWRSCRPAAKGGWERAAALSHLDGIISEKTNKEWHWRLFTMKMGVCTFLLTCRIWGHHCG